MWQMKFNVGEHKVITQWSKNKTPSFKYVWMGSGLNWSYEVSCLSKMALQNPWKALLGGLKNLKGSLVEPTELIPEVPPAVPWSPPSEILPQNHQASYTFELTSLKSILATIFQKWPFFLQNICSSRLTDGFNKPR